MDSFVSRAKTAFHSTAAKAEKVFTDIKKSDPNIDQGEDLDKQSNAKDGSEEDEEAKNLRWRPAPIKTKHDWHEKFKSIRIGKKGIEDPEKAEKSAMAYAIFDENLYLVTEREVSQSKDSNLNSPAEGLSDLNSDIIPPIAVMKQLAVAIEVGKNFKTMRDLMASSKDSSPVRERASLSFSAVKSLVLREKEEKLSTEFGNNEKVLSVIRSLLDSEGQFTGWKSFASSGELTNITSLPKDIHGAPPDSFVAKVSEAIGSLKTLRKMASFWTRIVAELRRLWSEGQYIPGIPLDESPDLNLCLLYQQLQVINCCISRKKRRAAATRSLDSVLKQTASSTEFASNSEDAALEQSALFARVSTGELVPRLGADKLSGLTMLETDEPIYAPVLQEMPLLTEDIIKETEEFVLRTGSVGAGCSQLLSDMQAFKAANPGCILEDFVRWHSPPDWMEPGTPREVNETSDGGDLLSSRGQLSQRMQKEGNLWRELWETAKPVPAVRQTPLFEEDLAVEGILNFLEDITPSELFEQLFISLLGTGFVIAEGTLSTNSSLSKLFLECRNYVVATCQGSSWVEKVDDICQVYETVETMLLNPDEVINVTVQPEETNTAGELKNRFKRISLIFSSKDKNSGKTPPSSKDQKNADEKTVRQSITSIFSKKPPKPSSGSPADKSLNSVENDWTLV